MGPLLPPACALSIFALITVTASFIVLMLPSVASPAAGASQEQLPVATLKDSSSLYLREAASSPVRWQSWSEASLALARKLDRPLLLDIGAVWCHWCHVMDQTTYADPQVAALINSNFVPVKIDRDQRPDIDQYYQQVAARLSGVSGWPLTCFTLPDGALFLALGYLPPQSNGEAAGLAAVLEKVASAYRGKHKQIEKDAREFATRLAKAQSADNQKPTSADNLRARILAALEQGYDRVNGGFSAGSGPRFYDFSAIELAMATGFFGHPEFTAAALESLRKIARGGVYDQLGGGFHRYSTDNRWRVPHFEKMGYDQAMALVAYAEAFQLSADPEFQRIGRGVAAYVATTLFDPVTSTFYSHQDADSFPGDDGGYYTWTRAEIARALTPAQARAAFLYYGVDHDPATAPDGRIVLRRARDPDTLARKVGVDAAQTRRLIADAQARLLRVRETRRAPSVDTAVLIDRNALMARAFIVAANVFADQTMSKIALADLDYLWAHARAADGTFYHVVAASIPSVCCLAADQVYIIDALLAAYQVSGDPRFLERATATADLLLAKFRNPASGLLADHGPAEDGTVLKSAAASTDGFYDFGQAPPPLALAAEVLEALAELTSQDRYRKASQDLILAAERAVNPDGGSMLATLGQALEADAHGVAVVAVVGAVGDPRVDALLRAARATYRPAKLIMPIDLTKGGKLPKVAQAMYDTSRSRGAPMAFVCAGRACANPVSTPDDLAKTLKSFAIGKLPSGSAL